MKEYTNQEKMRLVAEIWALNDISRTCEGCSELVSTKDGFGTGDSPTLYECACMNPVDCQHLPEYIESLEEDNA